MIRKGLCTFVLCCCACCLFAQQDLQLPDGNLLAHDVARTGQMPPALHELLRGRCLNVVASPQAVSYVRPRARRLSGAASAAVVPVAPLLHSIRGQEEPYNLLCPRWTFADGTVSDAHCLSGCVATAIEQVMAYYRHPVALADTLHGWQTDNYVVEDLLPGTRFDWDNYLLDYRDGWGEQQGLAIALPSLAAGMAVHMSYGLTSSGANVYRAVEPLQRALDYGMVRYYERILYTPERWHAMLCHELQAGRPIVYAGHTMTMSGHCFNIDGVDDRGFYHLNWGYDGYYDGWYDLDLLSPWEPADRSDEGLRMGFYSNQSALFMHPSAEAVPLEPDTLALDRLGVVLEAVDFLRTPDLQGYVGADFRFRNDGDSPVTYTYEVMTWLPTDTAIFYQADYVGLSAITLAPGERRSERVYLHFEKSGDRLFGISHDDVTIPFTQPLHINVGTAPRLEWESDVVETHEQASDGTFTYTFEQTVRNAAASGYAGTDVTLCLYADGYEGEDSRHYRVLSLAAGETSTFAVTFTGLAPATHYTYLVRCPWPVRAQLSFTTPTPTGIAVTPWQETPAAAAAAPTGYDLAGRPAQPAARGIIIGSDNHKWLRK